MKNGHDPLGIRRATHHLGHQGTFHFFLFSSYHGSVTPKIQRSPIQRVRIEIFYFFRFLTKVVWRARPQVPVTSFVSFFFLGGGTVCVNGFTFSESVLHYQRRRTDGKMNPLVRPRGFTPTFQSLSLFLSTLAADSIAEQRATNEMNDELLKRLAIWWYWCTFLSLRLKY